MKNMMLKYIRLITNVLSRFTKTNNLGIKITAEKSALFSYPRSINGSLIVSKNKITFQQNMGPLMISAHLFLIKADNTKNK